jgi:hypothetical protein
MDAFMKLSRDLQLLLGGTVLYLIMSFLDWQQVSVGPISAGVTEWHGVGIIAGLLAVALLAWELARLFSVKIELPLTSGQVSVGLALLLLIFTVITFLSHSAYRHWPEYLGLILSIVIAVVAVRRAKAEGVEVPRNISTRFSAATAQSGGSSSGGTAPEPEASAGPPDASTPDAG